MGTPEHDIIPPLDPDTIAHFMAVHATLDPEEATVARAIVSELAAYELRAWFDDLKKLSIVDASRKLRDLVWRVIDLGSVDRRTRW